MTSVKTLALATAAILVAGAASAADLYVARKVMPPPPPVVFNWSGVYLGLQGGWDYNRAANVTGPPATSNPSGGLVGLYGGYNFMLTPAVLLGIDGSINYDWATAPVTGFAGYTGDVDWKAFLRGRLGYAIDKVLFYGTGGASWANLAFNGPNSGNNVRVGWTAGGGIEMAFTSNITGRLDYAYANYGTHVYTTPAAFSTSHTSSTITAGIAFKY